MSAHKGGDSVNSYEVKVVDKNKLYVDCIPSPLGNRVFQPHNGLCGFRNLGKGFPNAYVKR
jgi:hypothetical protein